MCDHGCACDNLLHKVPSIQCTAQAQTNKSCNISHCTEVADRLARLLLVGSLSDVTFVVGGEQFHVHRLIMALQSEYFSRLLYGHMKEALPGAVVVMENTSPDAFRHLLHYAYSGNISIPAGKVEVRCVCVCV